MSNKSATTRVLHVEVERWPLKAPFRITGRTTVDLDVVLVTLEQDGRMGRGEAAGVYYRGETPHTMVKQIECVRPAIESGLDRELLQRLLPPGGARNAVDSALWDLSAKLAGRPVWQMAGLGRPRPLLTTYTCGAGEPEAMAIAARIYAKARAIKIKLTGEPVDADRVRAVREARGDVWLGVDGNQGFTLTALERLLPVLTEATVALIEQPLPVGQEALLHGFRSPIPIAADESAQIAGDIDSLVGRFDVVNIKIDKCGGLTEGLAMASAARQSGLVPMVGNMLGTSIAMAPAFLIGQLCTVVDLDGPVFLKEDRDATVEYSDGFIICGESVWG